MPKNIPTDKSALVFGFVCSFYADTKPTEVISMTTTVIVIPTIEDTPSPINPPTLGTYRVYVLQYHNVTNLPRYAHG